MVLTLTLCNSCASTSFQSYNQCYNRSSKSVMAFLSCRSLTKAWLFSISNGDLDSLMHTNLSKLLMLLSVAVEKKFKNSFIIYIFFKSFSKLLFWFWKEACKKTERRMKEENKDFERRKSSFLKKNLVFQI